MYLVKNNENIKLSDASLGLYVVEADINQPQSTLFFTTHLF